MGPTIDPADTDPTLPSHVDVVVIGGGIIGISAALHLARTGVSVLLCEKGKLAGSSRAEVGAGCERPGATCARCR